MKPLTSVFELEWNPRILVEASAGTGKTYTIVGIFIRLLVEKNLPVNRILVMTFTNKATSELRGRILKRLRECLNMLNRGTSSEDPFLADFSKFCSGQDKDKIIQQLKEAIRNFDDNRIFTIHGFCQKVLSDEALLAGVPFSMDVIQNDDLLLEAAGDFWRTFMNRYGGNEGGRYYISKLLKLAASPAELIGRDGIGEMVRRKEAVVEGSPHPEPVQFLQRTAELRRELQKEWNSSRSEIEEVFEVCDLKAYTDRNNSSRISKMERFANDLSYASDTFDQLKYFTSGYVHDENNYKMNASHYVKELRFFDLCDEFERHISGMGSVDTALIREVHDEIAELRTALSEMSGSLTYDDLLIRLREALRHPETGEGLSKRLLRNYPWALVDEFQDTDSIQYEIFDTIYPKEKSGNDGGLMMIGDPKQAIYAFRGADVYTYFRAGNDGNPDRWSLNKNFRSTPKLIEAVNKLFGNEEIHPFVEEQITFFDSECGNPEAEQHYLVNNSPAVPFSFILKPGLETNKSVPQKFAYSQTVFEVMELLNGNTTIRDDESKQMRPLRPGDIAILVLSHYDASAIKNRLKDAGIGSVTYSQEKVFDTFEAKRLELVMNAVLNPADRIAVNNALLSGLFGRDLEKLNRIREDEQLRTELITELSDLTDTWKRHGFFAMFRKLLFREGRIDQLSRLRNSERILTNLHQLAELCAAEEINSNRDPHELYSWYVRQMVNPAKSDEQQLLLESDQNLVKISTIHGSKGLEFPVVICPVLWSTSQKKAKFVVYHREGSDRPVINIDQYETAERVAAENAGEIESIAEEVRKAYVAVTRAKYDCRVIWSTHDNSHRSGLAAALTGRNMVKDGSGRKLKEGDDVFHETLIEDPVRELCEAHPGLFRLKILDNAGGASEEVQLSLPVPDVAPPESYNGRMILQPGKKIESFSSLAGHQQEAGEPDHDQITEQYLSSMNRTEEQEGEISIFGFPRGATPGTAIHKLFEHPGFRFDTAENDDHSAIIEEVLDQYAISQKWSGVLQQMIRDTALADYGELKLSRVQEPEMLREMEFSFPADESDADKLMAIIRNGREGAARPNDVSLFLTGFIDLIVRQNGKYYILDYKSNHLGNSPEDYGNEHLKREILAAGYDLQYHLYMAALAAFLKERTGSFDYDRDFGGIFYLFVRGMKKGSQNGIWSVRPPKEVFESLCSYLGVNV
jgi:exodeoxyribonuclease V beta subunit